MAVVRVERVYKSLYRLFFVDEHSNEEICIPDGVTVVCVNDAENPYIFEPVSDREYMACEGRKLCVYNNGSYATPQFIVLE